MRVIDSNAWRSFARRPTSRLRSLVALLCVLCLVISAVFVIRPVPAAAKALQGQEFMQTLNLGSKKPCERAGLSRVGTTCSSVVFLGAASGATGMIERCAGQAEQRALHRVVLATQCLAGSPFRPPRDQA